MRLKYQVQDELKKLTGTNIRISYNSSSGTLQVLLENNDLFEIPIGDLEPDRVNSVVRKVKQYFPEYFL